MNIPNDILDDVVARALREDIGHGDITTLALIPADAHAEAHVAMREAGVLAGLQVLTAVWAAVDPAVQVTLHAADGDRVERGALIATVRGRTQSILTGERVALNLLQRLCGIATMTARYVEAVRGLPTKILDTRKTTPGLRALEKYAVHCGGGVNHRFGLFDAVLIKDNHLALMGEGIDTAAAVRKARAAVGPMTKVEVEVESIEQAREAAEAGADMILLDNMPPDAMREAVAVINGRALVEASGGITLETVRAAAESGVDFISVGALTHGARSLDISLDVLPESPSAANR
jgi:nicotinate-nucleotide pyrophosphorylase (carboxylating)